MALEQKLEPRLQQRLVMTPALQLAIKLLQLNRMELEGVLQQEMMENPMLEEQDGLSVDGEGADDAVSQLEAEEEEPPDPEEREEFEEIDVEAYFQDYHDAPSGNPRMYEQKEGVPLENTLASEDSMEEQLLWQLELTHADGEEVEIARAIVGNLDAEGYLAASLEEIAGMGPWEPEAVERALERVQELEPPGVAARDLQECLLIQLRHLELSDDLPERIIRDHMDLVKSHRYPDIARACGVELEDIAAAMEVIQRLDPKPGHAYGSEPSQYITPDVRVTKDGDGYRVVLNEEGLPRLRISKLYRQMLRSSKDLSEEASEYLESKLRSAMWLIKSFGQRQRTIRKVSESIVKHQRDFLDEGVTELRPLVLRDVADDIEMHESTVSRVVNGKYMHTPQGIYEMRFFFHSSLGHASGDEVSSVAVKARIRRIIEEEDSSKPLSDSRIAAKLEEDGLEIARRTVAKYREEMGIPASKARKAIV